MKWYRFSDFFELQAFTLILRGLEFLTVFAFPSGQGSSLGMRLLGEDECDMSTEHFGQFRFDDGGMRGLAAALCWCGLVYHVVPTAPDQLAGEAVVRLVRGLLEIPTYHRAQCPDQSAAMISRIIKQNVDSKVQSVSSFEWSQILASMAKSGEKITLSEAIEMYNGSAEISAHGGSSSKERMH